jgi:predicted metal-dependent hydrolase
VDDAPTVELKHSTLVLQIRPGSDEARRQEVLDSWYREQVRLKLPKLLGKWQGLMGVKATRIFVHRMKTRWGSCNPSSGNVRLNTELAKKPPECLEYILVHELAHLIEPTHNARFLALMDKYIPHWQQIKDELNRLPVRHETWDH